jgi:hypothetical protein
LRLEVVIRWGLNPPHQHGPNCSHHKAGWRRRGNIGYIPSDVASGRDPTVQDYATSQSSEVRAVAAVTYE